MPLKAIYRWFDWLAHRRKPAFLMLFVLLLASASFLALSLGRSRLAAKDRRDAYEALVGLERLLSTLRDAETGQRGFLLTGNATYLEPYEDAVSRFGDRLALVRKYRPFPPERIDLLAARAREKFAELEATIRMFREGHREEAVGLVRTDRGKAIMDAIRATIVILQTDERDRVMQAEADLARETNIAFAGFVGVTGIAMVMIVGLIVAYSREEQARRRAEVANAAMAGRYAAINRAAPGAIITAADDTGCIDEWNPAAEAIFGWSAAEAIGMPAISLIPVHKQTACINRMRDGAAAASLRCRAWEMYCRRKDGEEFPAEVFLDHFEMDGRGHGIGIVRDITPRKHMESQQRILHIELERSNQDLQQFAYVASHDLQEPLRMIDKFLGLFIDQYGSTFDDQARRYVGFAIDGARRMRRLIDDLLRYSRLTTMARPSVSINLETILREVRDNLVVLAEREGGMIRVMTNMPVIIGETFQIQQLFQNLIANGLKFHVPGVAPVVTVACDGNPDNPACVEHACWHFTVSDNGIGIPENQLPKLFQLFTRLHAREDYEGTGIGLAICKKIVERHGGRIWVESTPGQGSTFHFTLPKEQ